MFALVFNVSLDRFQVGCAHAESPVALLPGEVDLVFAQPAGGVGFEYLHGLGPAMSGGSVINKWR